jgi:membrane protease YdiL (CAAX protease family)
MKNISMFFKNSKPFHQLLGLLFLFVLGAILSGGFLLLIPTSGDSPTGIRMQLVRQMLSQLLIFLLPACLFALLYYSQPRQYLKINIHGRQWFLAFVAVVMALLLIPLNNLLTSWNGSWNLGPLESSMRLMSDKANQMVEQMLSLTSYPDLLLQLFVVALVPAVCEEIFFRGGLQQVFHKWFGNIHVAIFVTALVFSIAHGDLYGLVPRFLLGLVLGYLFFFSGTIWVSAAAHFLNNASVVVLYNLYHRGIVAINPADPLSIPWHIVVMCTLGALFLFLLYFFKKQPQNGSPRQNMTRY